MSGKKFTDALKKFDRDQFYTPTEALGLVKTMASAISNAAPWLVAYATEAISLWSFA